MDSRPATDIELIDARPHVRARHGKHALATAPVVSLLLAVAERAFGESLSAKNAAACLRDVANTRE